MVQKPLRILIGCPTYDGQAHCIERFMQGLKELTYKNYDVVFVDNSLNDAFAQKIKTCNYEVIRNPAQGERIVNIVNNRKIIITRALEKKYDYLFFVDTDVLLPPNAIQKLLAVKQPISSGVYLSGLPVSGSLRIAPVLYDFSEKEDYYKIIPMNDVMEDLIFEIAACGFGCCLIRREVLEKVQLRYNEKIQSGEDIFFCYDARKLGYRTFVNTTVRCTHMVADGDVTFPAGVAHFSVEYDLSGQQ